MSLVTDMLGKYVQPQADAAAASATQAAIDTATQKPFKVIISVDPLTQLWITCLLVVGGVLLVRARKA